LMKNSLMPILKLWTILQEKATNIKKRKQERNTLKTRFQVSLIMQARLKIKGEDEKEKKNIT
jgi:hypothetical protein